MDADHLANRSFNAETQKAMQGQTDQIKQSEEQIAQVQQQLMEMSLNIAQLNSSENAEISSLPPALEEGRDELR